MSIFNDLINRINPKSDRQGQEANQTGLMRLHNVRLGSYRKNAKGEGGDKRLSGIVGLEHYLCLSPRRANGFYGIYSADSPGSKTVSRIKQAHFGGVLFPFYGHFLIESLSLLPNIPNDGLPIIFLSMGSSTFSWQMDFFKDIGLSERLVLTKEGRQLLVDTLYVADQTTVLGSEISYKFVAYLKSLYNYPKGDRRLYVSREKYKNTKVSNEKALQNILQSQFGFEVIYPETLSVSEQVRLYESAALIAGVEGSAFHTLMFCSTPKKVLIFRRRRRAPHTFVLQFARQPHIDVVWGDCMARYALGCSDSADLDVDAAISKIGSVVHES